MIKDFFQFEGYLPESRIKLKSFVMALQVTISLYLIIHLIFGQGLHFSQFSIFEYIYLSREQ